MSYAQKKEISGNRTTAIIVVAILHAILGYALVTGLAYNVIKKAAEDLKTFDVEEEPPPPEETPPPPENVPDTPPPVVAPPPIVRTNTMPPPVTVVPVAPPVQITPTAPPAPPAPPPVRTVPPKSAVGNLQGLFSPDDYPPAAADNEEQGTVTVRLAVGTNGRVSDCSVSSSSGSRSLDSTTCRILRSRARFTPATDNMGNPTVGSHTQRITWRLQ